MKRLIIGMTGATGAIYGKRLLEVLRQAGGWQTHLVVSDAGALNIQHELGMKRSEICSLADKVHGIDDIAASIASRGVSNRRNDHCALFDENPGGHCPWVW